MKKEYAQDVSFRRKPEWLKIKLPRGFKAGQVVGMLNDRHLHTICSSGMCPNRAECWGNGTATFMIGGNVCTRACRFCNVATGRPSPLDMSEIGNICRSVGELNLRHVVITSVDRDDLPDMGSIHWARMIRALREECPGVTMEVLIPDFRGDRECLDRIVAEAPEVVSHNLETVERLTHRVRSVATYRGSLDVLRYLASCGMRVKSGIMLGLGETREEVLRTMDDLLDAGCRIMTIGQYLQPTRDHFPIHEYVHPDVFAEYGRIGREKGFEHIESAPMVRSSYHAEKHV